MASERPAPRAARATSLAAGVRALIAPRPGLRRACTARNGLPPMWARRPGFPTLVHIVLEQQVSIAAARSLFRRVCAHARRHDAGARRWTAASSACTDSG